MCSPPLQVQHLQQIKHLLPDAFSWQHVMTSSTTASSRQEQQLVIDLPDRQTRGASGTKEHLDLLQDKLQAYASGKVSTLSPSMSWLCSCKGSVPQLIKLQVDEVHGQHSGMV